MHEQRPLQVTRIGEVQRDAEHHLTGVQHAVRREERLWHRDVQSQGRVWFEVTARADEREAERAAGILGHYRDQLGQGEDRFGRARERVAIQASAGATR